MYILPSSIEPTTVYAGCIAAYENVWDSPQATIDAIERVTSDPESSVKFKPAGVRGETPGTERIAEDVRTNSHLSISTYAPVDESIRILNNRFFELTYSAVNGYTESLGITESIFFVEEFNLLKYQTGQEYKAHYDGGTATHRSISPILYLNDDYTGGEIEFVNFGIKIKPKAGTLMLFPASYAYRHIAHPVKTGTKYAVVTWLHDQPKPN